MENPTKRTLTDDPQYFGVYLNMARHNVFIINNHLADKLNGITGNYKLKNLIDDEGIPDSFIGKEIKYKPNLFFTQLTRFLPIAKVYTPERLPKEEREKDESEIVNFKTLADDFKICFKELNNFRNDYTHFYSILNGSNRKITIDEDLSIFLRTNYLRAIEYTRKRFADVFEDSHFGIAEKIELVDKDNKITEKGLVFFVCLFLDRENAFRFINGIVGFKNTTTPEFKATREVFLAFCVNLPHDKFISEDPKQAFALDMLNELNRCPDVLYKNITEKEKKQFQPDINEKIDAIEDNSIPEDIPFENYEEYIQSITTRYRRKDRFPYFALKYLDMNNFALQFQLDLGKVLLTSKPKMFLGKEEERDIVNNIKVFGRLNSFENEKEIINKIDNTNTVNFIQFSPHFHIENNKIGFSLNPKTCSIKPDAKQNPKLKQSVPDGFLSIHELPKVVLLEILGKGKSIELIKSFLKINQDNILNKDFIAKIKDDLKFDKTFYRSFQKKKGSAYKADGLKILSDRKSTLNLILKEYGLNDKQIPGRILDYWLNINPVKDITSISNNIKAMKKDCNDRLKAKRKNKAPKIGAMATFLARDIVDMIIDENVKKKITSFYYDKMQECLALFANTERKQIFIDMCNKELNLFDTEIGHPFLADLNLQNINKTSELYEKYLVKKGEKKKNEDDKSWLYTTFYTKSFNQDKKRSETKVNLPKDLAKIPFSIRNLLKEKSSFDQWLNYVLKGCKENDKKKPVDLPTNIFDDALVLILWGKLKTENIPFNEIDKFSKLLNLLFNDTQPFYNAEREYLVYDEPVRFTIENKKKKFKEFFGETLNKVLKEKEKERAEDKKTNKGLPKIDRRDVLGVFNDAITENEKIIRFYQTKDRILLQMVLNVIGADKEMTVKLKDIYPLSPKSPLNEQEEITQKIEGLLSYNSEGKHLDSSQRTIKISKTVKSIRKRKDYTIFRKFVTDKRLPELFEYFNEDFIEYEVLGKELEEYNKHKELVFDRVFDLEKFIISSPDSLKSLIVGDIGHIQHEPYLSLLLVEKLIDEKQKQFLNTVRNAFSHNQFPPKIIIEKFLELKDDHFSMQIFEKYNEEVEKVLEKIANL